MGTHDKILLFVIEDNSFFLDIVTTNLSDNDRLTIRAFTSAEEALEHIDENPEIIVLDYYLDKDNADAMNGMQAMRKIKDLGCRAKIIILSGQDSLETAGDLIDEGAYDYVIKDSDALKILERKIDKVLLELQ
jgi:two-component system OmpR family response regulator